VRDVILSRQNKKISSNLKHCKLYISKIFLQNSVFNIKKKNLTILCKKYFKCNIILYYKHNILETF